jgi:membrane-bound lytic murein transglycosylase A
MSDHASLSAEILELTSYDAIAGWRDDDHAAALDAFLLGASLMQAAPKTKTLGAEGTALQRIGRIASARKGLKGKQARAFFEEFFQPWRIKAEGFVTGYYEPEVEARLSPGKEFRVPLYRRPHDLVDVSDENRPAGWHPNLRFGRRTREGIIPFYDRGEIEGGALSGRGLELAYLRDFVTAFFIHVQGSARLRLKDGRTLRIAFDGKSGHPYASIGRLAVERGILSREAAHSQGLEAWLRAHPEEGRALMRENRSFIFFRVTGQAEDEGPIGAAGVPLAAGRGLAIDRTLVTFHTPVFVEAEGLADPDSANRPFRRLMIAQDTGSAITGPGRGDIFFGSGARAASLAGDVRHSACMVLLLPRASAP